MPQVATERDWDVRRFLDAVCEKAGYAPDAWEADNVTLYRFSAQVFGESQG